MLGMVLVAVAWAGVGLTDGQLVTDVRVACNYTGGDVIVVAAEGEELARELLASTCAEVRSCSSRGSPREILDWHGRKGRCAIYLLPAGREWYSSGLGYCGPIAAGRVVVELEWPPSNVSIPALCAWDHTHPACLLDVWVREHPGVPLPWHGACPPGWARDLEACHPPEDHGEEPGVVTRWHYSWGPDSAHPPSTAIPLRRWNPGTTEEEQVEEFPWSGETTYGDSGSTPLSPWDYVRYGDQSGAPVGRAPPVGPPP